MFLHWILVEFSVAAGVSNKGCLTPVGDSLGFIYFFFLKPVEVSCRCFCSQQIHNLIWSLGRKKFNDSVQTFSFISLRFLVVELRNHVTYWSTETLLMTSKFKVVIYKKNECVSLYWLNDACRLFIPSPLTNMYVCVLFMSANVLIDRSIGLCF